MPNWDYIRKHKCKATMRQCQSLEDGDWEDIFTVGKWYEVRSNKYNFLKSPSRGGYILNEIQVKTEHDDWKSMPKSEFEVTFFSYEESRDELINDIIK